MSPLTVLLWLLCAFICVVFIAVPILIVYMNKQRKKAIEEFNTHRKQMGLKPHNIRLGDNTMTIMASEQTQKAFTKGPSQGV